MYQNTRGGGGISLVAQIGRILRSALYCVVGPVVVITLPDWLQLVLKCSEFYNSRRLDENATKNCWTEF